MRLLDRYLLRELMMPLGFCLGGFLVFWIGFDLLSRLSDLQEAHLTSGKIAWYYIMRLPELIVVALPIGLLLAMLYAMTTHARHHELVAIRAAGVSVWRLSAPYLTVGTFLGVVLFGVNELWSPYGTAAADALITKQASTKNARTGATFEKVFFNNSRDGRIWAMDYKASTREIRGANVEWQLPDGSHRTFAAERGIYTNGNWLFFNARQQTDIPGEVLPANRMITNRIVMQEFTETPEQIRSAVKISSELKKLKNWQKDRAEVPLKEIISFLRFNPKLNKADGALLYTKLHGRIAAPFTCIVVVLIAIPFGAASGRRNVFVGVASGIFICFAYFILLQVGLALGAGAWLPAWLAAWLPNLAFGSAALFFIYRVR